MSLENHPSFLLNFSEGDLNVEGKHFYRFKSFRLNVEERQLLKNKSLVPLTPKAFDVLSLLVERGGHLVKKDELLNNIWADSFVEEANIPRIVHTLRKTLGEDGNGNKFIETVSKKGYRFVAKVSKVRNSTTQISGNSTQDSSINLKKISEQKGTPPNNLMSELLPFFGRKAELSEITYALYKSDTRLFTITGAGGTGKTRLAKAIARKLLSTFAKSVYFIDLSTIENPELVLPIIGKTLGIHKEDSKQLKELLHYYLREREVVIVLDNFEQILEAASSLTELLSESANLKILVTSRVRLNLPFEHVFHLQPLEFPIDKELPPEQLKEYPAVELFVERAQTAKSNFVLTNKNAKFIAEICGRLDGLPLSIVLVAAHIKLLSPQAILDRLKNSLNLLTSRSSALPVRQQTMRNVLEWSYNLLDTDEQLLFNRLAVFSGGFSVEAAEAVAQSSRSSMLSSNYLNFEIKEKNEIFSDSSQNEFQILDLIESLIDKSLLEAKELSGDETQLQMLEVVREFALEKLEKSGETEIFKRKHAEYFLAFSEEAERHLQTAQACEWLNRLENGHANLRAAFRWLLENAPARAARLTSAIRIYLINRNYLTEGREWMEAALERNDKVPVTVRFKLFNGLGYMAFHQGDYETARKLFGEDLAEGRTAGDKKRIAESLRGLGAVAYMQGDQTGSRKFHEEGLAIHRELKDPFGIACSLNGLGVSALGEDNMMTAHRHFKESLTIFRQVGNESGICYCLLNLGVASFLSGDFEAAQEYFGKVIKIAQNLGYNDRIISCLGGFSALAVKRGKVELAAKLAGAAEGLGELIDSKLPPPELHFRDGYLAELKSQMNEADFTELYEQGRKLNLEEVIALCLKEISEEAKN